MAKITIEVSSVQKTLLEQLATRRNISLNQYVAEITCKNIKDPVIVATENLYKLLEDYNNKSEIFCSDYSDKDTEDFIEQLFRYADASGRELKKRAELLTLYNDLYHTITLWLNNYYSLSNKKEPISGSELQDIIDQIF